MKKNSLYLIPLIFAALSFVSCQDDNHPSLGDTGLSFEEMVKYDFDFLKSRGTKPYHFYEVECQLNGTIDELKEMDAKIVFSRSIGAMDNVVYFMDTDMTAKSRSYSQVSGHWAGCFTIPDPTAVKVTFKEAVYYLRAKSDLELPHSDKMTFRHPIGLFGNPMYIFGDTGTRFIAVDANTGEVMLLDENTVSSSLSF